MLAIAFTAAGVAASLLTLWYFLAAKRARLAEARNTVLEAQPTIEDLHSRLTELFAQDRYIAHHEIAPLTELANSIRTALAHEPEILSDSSPIRREFEKCREFWLDSSSLPKRHNRLFVDEECKKFKSYFDSIEKYPLTTKQSVAAVTNEDNTLVVAGAGTGKTSVMAARVGYLIKRGLVTPERLLALAYSRKARQELQERIKKRCKCDVTIKTFHALGLEIIGMAEGAKPSLSPLAEDETQKIAKLREIVTTLAVDSSFKERLLDYFSEFFAPSKCLFEFQSLYEYVNYMRSNEIRTFQGEKVKSFEECKMRYCQMLWMTFFRTHPSFPFTLLSA